MRRQSPAPASATHRIAPSKDQRRTNKDQNCTNLYGLFAVCGVDLERAQSSKMRYGKRVSSQGDGGRSSTHRRGSARLGRWLVGFVLAGLMLSVAPASATFHLIKIREVYPAGNASYVELQMLENG